MIIDSSALVGVVEEELLGSMVDMVNYSQVSSIRLETEFCWSKALIWATQLRSRTVLSDVHSKSR